GSGERPAVRAGAQREGAGWKPLGLAAAAGDEAMNTLRAPLATLALGTALGLVWVTAQQPPAAVFTADQAAAGRASYEASCAGCHMPDLAGRNEAPPLAGGTFMNAWRTRTTKDLFDYMSSTMPPNQASLAPDQYAAIVSFILQANGAP